jgi:hypothetical protein
LFREHSVRPRVDSCQSLQAAIWRAGQRQDSKSLSLRFSQSKTGKPHIKTIGNWRSRYRNPIVAGSSFAVRQYVRRERAITALRATIPATAPPVSRTVAAQRQARLNTARCAPTGVAAFLRRDEQAAGSNRLPVCVSIVMSESFAQFTGHAPGYPPIKAAIRCRMRIARRFNQDT